jgi:hypothetical protein
MLSQTRIGGSNKMVSWLVVFLLAIMSLFTNLAAALESHSPTQQVRGNAISSVPVAVRISERVISTMTKYISASQLIFSPDGMRVAYVAGFGARKNVLGEADEGYGSDGWHEHFVVLDGKKEKYSNAINFQFSPDSKHTAYLVESSNDGTAGTPNFLVLDGKKEKYSNGVMGFQFNADSKLTAYLFESAVDQSGMQKLFVGDGKEGKHYVVEMGGNR